MAKTFFDPSSGRDWRTTTEPTAETIASFPVGTIEIPHKPGPDYDWDGAQWVHNAPSVSDEQINFERDRRIDLGAEFTLAGGMVIAITGRQRDQTVLLGSSIAAQSLAGAGETNPVMIYRDRNNQNRMLTPQQMLELYQKGLAWITGMMTRSWEMKDGTGAYTSGAPADYDDDSHWPRPVDLGL